MCHERYKWLGWVGVLRYYSLAQTLTKPEKPQNQEKKKTDRQQNNAVITVVTRTKIREEKKRKEQGQGPMFQFLAW